MAKHLYTYVNPPSQRHLDEACGLLAAGGILAYPTDVNWGFGCDAASKQAMDRIRLLKPHHPKEQPFTLLCDSIAMASSLAHIDNTAYRLLKKLLPGPYTFLLPRTRDLPRQLKDKRKLVGVRVPESPLLLALISRYGKPLATTSLPTGLHSRYGKPITYGYEIEEIFGHGLDLILDLGEEVAPQETSIVDLSEGSPVIVRSGLGDTSIFERLGIGNLPS